MNFDNQQPYSLGPNDGGVKRGDSDETGDNEARPNDNANNAGYNDLDDAGLDDLTIRGASDPSLGLTNIGDVEAEDWAADTGPTRDAAEDSLEDTALDNADGPLN